MDLVVDDELDYAITDMDEEKQLQLCFNILPNGRSMLH